MSTILRVKLWQAQYKKSSKEANEEENLPCTYEVPVEKAEMITCIPLEHFETVKIYLDFYFN